MSPMQPSEYVFVSHNVYYFIDNLGETSAGKLIASAFGACHESQCVLSGYIVALSMDEGLLYHYIPF